MRLVGPRRASGRAPNTPSFYSNTSALELYESEPRRSSENHEFSKSNATHLETLDQTRAHSAPSSFSTGHLSSCLPCLSIPTWFRVHTISGKNKTSRLVFRTPSPTLRPAATFLGFLVSSYLSLTAVHNSRPTQFCPQNISAIAGRVYELRSQPPHAEVNAGVREWPIRCLRQEDGIICGFEFFAALSFPSADLKHLEIPALSVRLTLRLSGALLTCINSPPETDALSDKGTLQSKLDTLRAERDISLNVFNSPDGPSPEYPHVATYSDYNIRPRHAHESPLCIPPRILAAASIQRITIVSVSIYIRASPDPPLSARWHLPEGWHPPLIRRGSAQVEIRNAFVCTINARPANHLQCLARCPLSRSAYRIAVDRNTQSIVIASLRGRYGCRRAAESTVTYGTYAEYLEIHSLAGAVIFAILYLPVLAFFVTKAFARPTYVYIILCLFATIRVTAFILRAILTRVYADQINLSFFLAYEIIYNVGFFGLLYSTYILGADRDAFARNDNIISRIIQKRFLFRLCLMAAVAIGITGAVQSSSGGSTSSVNTGNTPRKVGIYIFGSGG
ncbi:hypothetical protein BV22DRAFT_1134715 [Leucogyrophana mollusca]|uniref:Uncharacterized protein n=1 Tax=Leucogyrophana mollusca TaxID=85980 RepID=A0ACB8AXY2_9AGAM|nr:hypothetical protein BV22DRAFT_1134715 [Leucogyrophana mollusca]